MSVAMALLLAWGAGSASARPTHRCVARSAHGCPNQHGVVHVGQAVRFGPTLELSGGKRRHHTVKVVKTTDQSSPGLYKAAK